MKVQTEMRTQRRCRNGKKHSKHAKKNNVNIVILILIIMVICALNSYYQAERTIDKLLNDNNKIIIFRFNSTAYGTRQSQILCKVLNRPPEWCIINITFWRFLICQGTN